MKLRYRHLLLPLLLWMLSSSISCKHKEYAVPVADFSYTLQNECNIPLEVSFNNLSNGGEIFRWDFGDGTAPVYGEAPRHIYLTEGVYTVELTAYSNGGMHSEHKLVYVVSSPQADFSASQQVVDVNDTVYFTGTSLSGVLPSAWYWNFGDGSTSTFQNPVHVYTTAGLYTVTLTVLNACGSDFVEKIQYIQVNALGSPPLANFTADNTNITTGQSVNFTDLSLNNPTSWSWSFQGGNPATSTLQHPQNIVYNTAGNYNVTLTATNGNGSDTYTRTAYIQVLNSVPTKCSIQKVTVKQMPFPPPPPSWVNLYFRLTDASTTTLYTAYNQPIQVYQSSLPVFWDLNPPYVVNNINHLYYIELYGKRMSPPDIYIGQVQFNLNNYTSGMNPYPTVVTLAMNGINIDLQLAWQ